MANDYIPADDASLIAFTDNFTQAIEANEANFGLVPADFAELDALAGAYGVALQNHNAAQNNARQQKQAKDNAKAALLPKLRNAAQRANISPAINDQRRAALGLTIRDATPTAVSAPTTQPVLFVDTANRLQHIIRFRDSLTPTSKAKPAGVFGCEIYRKIGGDAPASVQECEFVGLDSATPYLLDYGSESGGQQVHYLGRWATRSGLTGPTSDLISATVVA